LLTSLNRKGKEKMKSTLLMLLMLISLTVGCATPASPEASDAPESTKTEVGETAEPIETATAQATMPESRPPAVEDMSTPTPAEMASIDLAHRLNADVQFVEVVEVTTRAPDPDEMVCLTDGSVPEALWTRAETVQWIALSVKGNLYHYVALGDLVVYCEG
jgi:hypothetical protein